MTPRMMASCTSHCSTASRTACAFCSTSAARLSSAFCSSFRAPSNLLPLTALFIVPKGIPRPFGATKPAALASFSSLPQDAALPPATWGLSAMATASSTSSASRLSAPSFGAADAAGFVALEAASDAGRVAAAAMSSSLAASTRAPPVGSTTSLTRAPSLAPDRSFAKSVASEVQAKTTPSCRARRARWLSTGRSRPTTTPRTRPGISSSPLASSQKTTTPSAGSCLDQASDSAPRWAQRPQRDPGDMAVQSGSPASALACCRASCASFETWNSTEARSSASTKTEHACSSIPRAFPRAGTPAYASSSFACRAKQMRMARSIVAASRIGAKGALDATATSGATASTSRATAAHSSGERPLSSVCARAKTRARRSRSHHSGDTFASPSRPPATWLRSTNAYLSSSTSRRSQFCSSSTLGATTRRKAASASSCAGAGAGWPFSKSRLSTAGRMLGT
mmetsp:Transcript_76485/g.206651  ORF Transcript_76485/g.206651 Transcript_76485/m.206651 type:complete len:454 (-) Transcript_76485:1110-2471(-)